MKADLSKKGNLISSFNLVFIFVAIVSKPVQMAFLRFDGAGRILFFLTILIITINLKDREFLKTLFSRPILFWLIWTLFSIINTVIKNPSNVFISYAGFNFWNSLLVPLLMMTITSMEFVSNETRLCKCILWSLIAYTFIGITFLDLSTHSDQTTVNTLGNDLSLNAMYIILYVGLLVNNRKMNSFFAVLLIIATFAIVIISAQRKAFGATLILLFAYVLSTIKFNIRSISKIVVLFVFLFVSYNYYMSVSTLGERFEFIEEEGEKANTTNVKALDFLGDRAIFYVEGWDIFKEHPLTGIGLNNFIRHSKLGLDLHTEYMVQLVECGLVGAFLFLLFYLYLIRNILKLRKQPDYRKSIILVLGGVFSILFIDLISWTYSSCQFFCCLGIAVGVINKAKQSKVTKLLNNE